jgi:catechol 2,3-dioxygenase-like lactoylglutathione lyase family enzyme
MGAVVSELCVDARDPRVQARWWAEVLGWRVVLDPDDDEVVELVPPDGAATPWLFARVPEAKQVKNRLHVDLRPRDGEDQASELARLLALGATRVDVGQAEVAWHVLADPEGNEFCLLHRTPAEVAADEHPA